MFRTYNRLFEDEPDNCGGGLLAPKSLGSVLHARTNKVVRIHSIILCASKDIECASDQVLSVALQAYSQPSACWSKFCQLRWKSRIRLSESRKESSGNLLERLLLATNDDVGRLEDKLARLLRFPLIQKGYVECWKILEACEAVFSGKQVEQSRKRQRSPTTKVIKGSTDIRNKASWWD